MPTIYGASDIQPGLDESGVPVTVGEVTARGYQDQVDEEMLRSEWAHLRGRITTVLVKTGVFALAEAADIQVDGVDYKIHDFAQIDDGGMVRITCVKVK